MTVRVNLMKEGEFRRQGAVSGAFIVRISTISIIAFGVLFGLLAVIRYRIARSDLLASREIWEMREPLYNQIQSMKQDLALERKLQEELGGWERARVDWHAQLLELQKVIPGTMQLRRLSIRGESELIAAPVTKSKDGKKPEEKPAGTPTRQYFITLEGKTSGEKAEDVVVSFVRVLGRTGSFQELVESIKLQSLQRDMSASGEQTDRRFSIDIVSKVLEVK